MFIRIKVLCFAFLFLILSIPVSAHHHHQRRTEDQTISPADQTEETPDQEIIHEATPTATEEPPITPSPVETDSQTLIHQEDPHVAGSGSDTTITIADNNSTPIQVPDPKPCDNSTAEKVDVNNVNDLHLSRDVDLQATDSAKIQSVVIGNTNLTGNCWVYTNVNVMGSQNGPIVLPSDSQVTAIPVAASPPQLNVTNMNNSNITDHISVSSEGTSATVAVTDLSEVNTNITGNGWSLVVIHTPGEVWTGSLIGFPAVYQRNPDMTYAYYQSPLSVSNNIPIQVSNTNNADITTNIHASVLSAGKAQVNINLLTIANTNITGNNWYYALINVFNGFNGDVVIPRPDLDITISPHNQVTHVGDEVIYTLSYKNRGLQDAADVEIVAGIPQDAQFETSLNDGMYEQNEVHWKRGLVKAGEEGNVIYKIKLGNNPYNSLFASARIHTSTYEWNLKNNESSTGIGVLPIPPQDVPIPAAQYDIPEVYESPVFTSEPSTPIILAAHTKKVSDARDKSVLPYTKTQQFVKSTKQLTTELIELMLLTVGVTVALVRMRSQIIDRV